MRISGMYLMEYQWDSLVRPRIYPDIDPNYLVVGQSPGSKLDEAKKLDIEIIDEITLKNMF
ncbi:MAG: hypothetical protein JW786_10685 [Desulfobacterales bacterium]|nr:hypothetical protein [Desulfobacterales bacterium]